MKYSYFLCLFMILMVIVPVSAAPVINPVVQSEPFLCRFWLTGWVCGATGTSGTAGGTGPQGIPGINGTGGGDINYYNFSGSNLTTISNITNFFNYTSIFSEMNQTANMTPGYTPIFGVDYFNGTDGAEGPPGPMNQTPNMTPGYTPVFGVDYFNGTDGTNGTNGTSTTIAINYTFTGLPGTEANITNVGNSTDALWDITIPQGIIGDTGATGGTGGQVLFYHHDPVESPAGYEGLFPTPAGTTEADEVVVVQTGTGQVLVDPYITVAGYPGLTTLPAGLWRFRTFHYVNSAPGNTNAVFKVYNRSGTTETLLFTATSGDINALVPTEYLTSYVQTLPYTVALTDRIVIKVYGQSDHSSNINFHFVYEGTNHTSHVQTPLETSSLLYIRHDGTVNFTGSQSMGGFNLTNVLNPVAAQDAATRNYVDTKLPKFNATVVNTTFVSSSYTVQSFTNVGNTNWQAPDGFVLADILIVGGGGGGSGGVPVVNYGGGGGGGTVRTALGHVVTPGAVFNITVGDHGHGTIDTDAGNGGSSVFDTITATGGNGHTHESRTGGNNTDYVGYTDSVGSNAGSGAGAGQNGQATSGGAGVTSSISGSSICYGGGGGGNPDRTASCGGGAGSIVVGGSGTVNTGGGGGGGNGVFGGGTGGSGIVILKYYTLSYNWNTITHNFGSTPTVVLVTTSVFNEIAAVTAITSTTFNVTVTKPHGEAGSNQTIYWMAA